MRGSDAMAAVVPFTYGVPFLGSWRTKPAVSGCRHLFGPGSTTTRRWMRTTAAKTAPWCNLHMGSITGSWFLEEGKYYRRRSVLQRGVNFRRFYKTIFDFLCFRGKVGNTPSKTEPGVRVVVRFWPLGFVLESPPIWDSLSMAAYFLLPLICGVATPEALR